MALKTVEDWQKNPAIQNAMARNRASRNQVVYNQDVVNGRSQDIKAKLEGMANSNAEESIWRENDKFVVPSEEILEKSLFTAQFGDAAVAGITVTLESGAAKNLYFSTLRKSVVPYADNAGVIAASGEAVHSNTPFYQEVMAQPDMLKVYELLASKTGKTITCSHVEPVTTARFSGTGNARVITGLRNAQVPFFTCE